MSDDMLALARRILKPTGVYRLDIHDTAMHLAQAYIDQDAEKENWILHATKANVARIRELEAENERVTAANNHNLAVWRVAHDGQVHQRERADQAEAKVAELEAEVERSREHTAASALLRAQLAERADQAEARVVELEAEVERLTNRHDHVACVHDQVSAMHERAQIAETALHHMEKRAKRAEQAVKGFTGIGNWHDPDKAGQNYWRGRAEQAEAKLDERYNGVRLPPPDDEVPDLSMAEVKLALYEADPSPPPERIQLADLIRENAALEAKLAEAQDMWGKQQARTYSWHQACDERDATIAALVEAIELVAGAGDEYHTLRGVAGRNHDCAAGTGTNVPSYHTCMGCWMEELADDLKALTDVLAQHRPARDGGTDA